MFWRLFWKYVPEPENMEEYVENINSVQEEKIEYTPPKMQPVPKHNRGKDLQEVDRASKIIHKWGIVLAKFDDWYNRHFSDGEYFPTEQLIFSIAQLEHIMVYRASVNFRILFPKKSHERK